MHSQTVQLAFLKTESLWRGETESQITMDTHLGYCGRLTAVCQVLRKALEPQCVFLAAGVVEPIWYL